MYYITTCESPIGKYTIACDERENLVGLWLEGQKYFADTIGTDVTLNNELGIFKRTRKWLDRYFRGDKPKISELPLKPIGNDFRQRVWQILCEIPYGEVYTYGEIAKIIAREQGKARISAQAIGGAVGHNPISIIIPCHRVVGANGNLTGYAGGIKTKIALLELEGIKIRENDIKHHKHATVFVDYIVAHFNHSSS